MRAAPSASASAPASGRASSALLSLMLLLAACGEATVIRGTTQLTDTQDTLGPYTVITEVVDPDGVDAVWLHFRPGAAGEVGLRMAEVRSDVYEGAIPGQPPFTTVSYYVSAHDGDDVVTDPPGARDRSERHRFTVLGRPCETELDCGPGEICEPSGKCNRPLGGCSTDADCGKGFRCAADLSCRLAVRSCTLDEMCLIGEVCDRVLEQCMPRPGCAGELKCPLDFTCDVARAICIRSCVGDADCGPGERCGAGACQGATPCAAPEECPEELTCDPLLGFCRPEGGGLCASCKTDADCGGPADYCLLLPDGLFCGRACGSDSCPDGYACSSAAEPPQCAPADSTCSP